MKRVGVLTGGGDCPGLNAVIRAVARRCFDRRYAVVGDRRRLAWARRERPRCADLARGVGILPRGGTIIGTSRTNPYKVDGGVERVLTHFAEAGLDALVAIGGEDTLGVAARLYAEEELPVVGVPKTIDNDLSATDYTFGFDTAVSIATEAIDRLHTTAESHNRVMVVEVMGRHTGWIAVMSGIAGGADVILIPEQPRQRRVRVRRTAQAPRARQELLDRRCQRRLQAHLRLRRGARGHAGGRARPVRTRPPRRRRRATRARDRGAHRLRDARDRARPRPAGRLADRPRPGARYPLRAEGGRPRPRGEFRPHGRAARRRDRGRLTGRGDRGAEDRAARVVRVARAFFG